MNLQTAGFLVFVFVHVILVSGLLGDLFVVYQLGGLSIEGIRDGHYWQLVSHLLIHGSWFHLFVNGLMFYYGASRLGEIVHWRKVVLVFWITGLFGGLAQLGAQFLFEIEPNLKLVGASGGIIGLLVCYFSFSPESRMFLFGISAKNLCVGFLLGSLILFLISPKLEFPILANVGRSVENISPGVFHVAHLVHFIGGVVGFFISKCVLSPLVTKEELSRTRKD